LAFKSPANYSFLSKNEKLEIGEIEIDFCEIHYEDQIDKFIRVNLNQKINDKSFSDYKSNYNNPNHIVQYFGWLCSNISEYDATLSIPCDVVTKIGNDRPEIFPHQDFEHTFVKDYYDGISEAEAKKRVQEMIKKIS
jgi:hypothetical protein